MTITNMSVLKYLIIPSQCYSLTFTVRCVGSFHGLECSIKDTKIEDKKIPCQVMSTSSNFPQQFTDR